MLPAPPAVAGDREPDVGGPAVEDAPDLEDGDDRGAVGRRVEVAGAVDGLDPVGAACAADSRRPRRRGACDEESSEDERYAFQLLPSGPPSGSRNG